MWWLWWWWGMKWRNNGMERYTQCAERLCIYACMGIGHRHTYMGVARPLTNTSTTPPSTYLLTLTTLLIGTGTGRPATYFDDYECYWWLWYDAYACVHDHDLTIGGFGLDWEVGSGSDRWWWMREGNKIIRIYIRNIRFGIQYINTIRSERDADPIQSHP